jgi:hypothetical protein
MAHAAMHPQAEQISGQRTSAATVFVCGGQTNLRRRIGMQIALGNQC